MEEQLVDIQMQLTFHDDGIDGLNLALLKQSNDIQSLKEEVQQLKAQVRELLQLQTDKIEDAPPPHY